MDLLRKCTAEFVGTFALVFAGCGAVIANQISGGAVTHVGVAISFGLVIMVMIYAVGHISGGHFNPAVTITLSATRNFPVKEVIPYLGAQCLGAVTASLLHMILLSSYTGVALNYGVTAPYDGLWMTAFGWEVVATFFLMFVIMAMATDYRAVGAAAGAAIGGTIMLDAMFSGPMMGASMNPARSLGPVLIQGDWSFFSAYVVGPIAGALLAGCVYQFIQGNKQKS